MGGTVSHPKIKEFQRRLKILFDEVDDYLEEKYDGVLSLHPNRPSRGSTSSKDQDGLFNVGAQFSAGYSSNYGRGYVIDLKIATLDTVREELRREITEDIIILINNKLKAHFPERELEVMRDRRGLKIVGNLSLGEL